MFNKKMLIIFSILVNLMYFNLNITNANEYTAIQKYYLENQENVFKFIKDKNTQYLNGWDLVNIENNTNIEDKSDVWDWEYLWIWNDEYYQNMKISEFDNKKLINSLLDKLKSNIEVNDNNIHLLNQNINKIYGNDNYYIFWIKFKNTSYFEFWENYIVLKPYVISWNKDYFNSEIKWSITKIINDNKDKGVEEQYKKIKEYLKKLKIWYYIFNKVDTTNIKLLMWEARSAKIEFENQPFFIDKWYQPQAIPKIQDTDLLIYTIIDKKDLERNNILNSNSNISLIQPYIKFWDISISMNYLWDSTYSNIWNKWRMKIIDYKTKQQYIVEKDNMIYFIIVILSILWIILWMVWNWMYYQKKYKEIFMKISEGTK